MNPSRLISHRLVLGLAISFCVGFAALVVAAQSGRRTPKKPDPIPEASPEPSPSVKPETEKPRVNISVGIAPTGGFSNLPVYYNDSVLVSCAERLRSAPSAAVHVTGREITRGQAIKLAKSQKEGFVVFLELKNDNMSATVANPNYQDLYLDYTVFGPDTAKVVTSGKTYPRAYSKGSVIALPTGRNSSAYVEQMLQQAARDAADRILSALHLVLPRTTAPGP